MKKSEINVFIVEDDNSVRASIAEAVKRAGYKPIPLLKPADALGEINLRPLHAAIIDCMLPGKNGVDLALEMRKEVGEEVPFILYSGVFKDKGFAAEARKKTGAIDFLYKPVDLKILIENLDVELVSLVDAPKVALHSLLSKMRASVRERRKALDHIEEGVGFDLPLIIAILLDSEATGHLNIIASDSSLHGVTIVKGHIIKVDSEESKSISEMVVTKHGFLTADELSELKQKATKKDIIDYLVKESMISPHVLPVLRKEQMFSELNNLITANSIQINFSPDRKLKSTDFALDVVSLAPLMHDAVEFRIEALWLKKFYGDWMDHPIRLGPDFSETHQVVSMPVISRLAGFIDIIRKEPTIEEILLEQGYPEDQLFKAIHLLALRRLIVFDESRRSSKLNETMTRLKLMFDSLKDKNPIEVFEFFGAQVPLRKFEVERIYKEFARGNHPDKLPQEAPPELKRLNNEVFSIVTYANEIVSNEESYARFQEKEKQKEAEFQLKAEEMIDSGLKLLQVGKYKEALDDFREAYRIYDDKNTLLYMLWARIKVESGRLDEEKISTINGQLSSFPVEERRTALYNFVQGLVRKESKDYSGAVASWQKALQFNPNFLDARREYLALKGESTKKLMSANDLLKADLSDVVSHLFKKKKG